MEYTIRKLLETDKESAEQLDDNSGLDVSEWVDSDEYVWGVFDENKLIGCCTIGYADDCGSEIESYPGWSSDSLILSNVYILPEYRRQGLALKLISESIRLHSETKNNLMFLTLLSSQLTYLYHKLDFNCISDYVMVKQC